MPYSQTNEKSIRKRKEKNHSLGLGGEDGGREMENWAVFQLEPYQVKENRMEDYKGRESSNNLSGEGS